MILAAIDFAAGAATAGDIMLYVVVGLMCLAAVIMSAVSLSGTWLVTLATLILVLMREEQFPGWWTLAGFVVASVVCEVLEGVASAVGVKKRGGSNWAGLAGCAGGFAGMFIGALIPIPVIGSLIGMFACSFGAVYLVEYLREKKADSATHIATGALLARVFVIFIKLAVTLGMILVLILGLIFGD